MQDIPTQNSRFPKRSYRGRRFNRDMDTDYILPEPRVIRTQDDSQQQPRRRQNKHRSNQVDKTIRNPFVPTRTNTLRHATRVNEDAPRPFIGEPIIRDTSGRPIVGNARQNMPIYNPFDTLPIWSPSYIPTMNFPHANQQHPKDIPDTQIELTEKEVLKQLQDRVIELTKAIIDVNKNLTILNECALESQRHFSFGMTCAKPMTFGTYPRDSESINLEVPKTKNRSDNVKKQEIKNPFLTKDNYDVLFTKCVPEYTMMTQADIAKQSDNVDDRCARIISMRSNEEVHYQQPNVPKEVRTKLASTYHPDGKPFTEEEFDNKVKFCGSDISDNTPQAHAQPCAAQTCDQVRAGAGAEASEWTPQRAIDTLHVAEVNDPEVLAFLKKENNDIAPKKFGAIYGGETNTDRMYYLAGRPNECTRDPIKFRREFPPVLNKRPHCLVKDNEKLEDKPTEKLDLDLDDDESVTNYMFRKTFVEQPKPMRANNSKDTTQANKIVSSDKIPDGGKMVNKNGTKYYYNADGLLHRDDHEPAVVADKYAEYWYNGKFYECKKLEPCDNCQHLPKQSWRTFV